MTITWKSLVLFFSDDFKVYYADHIERLGLVINIIERVISDIVIKLGLEKILSRVNCVLRPSLNTGNNAHCAHVCHSLHSLLLCIEHIRHLTWYFVKKTLHNTGGLQLGKLKKCTMIKRKFSGLWALLAKGFTKHIFFVFLWSTIHPAKRSKEGSFGGHKTGRQTFSRPREVVFVRNSPFSLASRNSNCRYFAGPSNEAEGYGSSHDPRTTTPSKIRLWGDNVAAIAAQVRPNRTTSTKQPSESHSRIQTSKQPFWWWTFRSRKRQNKGSTVLHHNEGKSIPKSPEDGEAWNTESSMQSNRLSATVLRDGICGALEVWKSSCAWTSIAPDHRAYSNEQYNNNVPNKWVSVRSLCDTSWTEASWTDCELSVFTKNFPSRLNAD